MPDRYVYFNGRKRGTKGLIGDVWWAPRGDEVEITLYDSREGDRERRGWGCAVERGYPVVFIDGLSEDEFQNILNNGQDYITLTSEDEEDGEDIPLLRLTETRRTLRRGDENIYYGGVYVYLERPVSIPSGYAHIDI